MLIPLYANRHPRETGELYLRAVTSIQLNHHHFKATKRPA